MAQPKQKARQKRFITGKIAVGAFIVSGCLVLAVQSSIGFPQTARESMGMWGMGFVALSPFFFRRSALLILLAESAILGTLWAVLVGCPLLVQSEWCSDGGSLLLFRASIATVYALATNYIIRGTSEGDMERGILAGIVTAAILFGVFPAVQQILGNTADQNVLGLRIIASLLTLLIPGFLTLAFLTAFFRERKTKGWRALLAM